jgi:hypothetical protein
MLCLTMEPTDDPTCRLQLRQHHLTIDGEPLRISLCHCLEYQRDSPARRSHSPVRLQRGCGQLKAHALTFHFYPTCGSPPRRDQTTLAAGK